jgi:hypothetical protein
MSLVVNGYLTDFTRLKYISADFVLPWELPERDLNCYRSDYCSETERYIVSESDQKFDWQEASERVENELATKEAACKADREKEKALKKAARRAQYVHEQALNIVAFEKMTADKSQSMDPSPLTPEAITGSHDNAAMVPNKSPDHTASSSDDALPTDDSFFTETVAHIEDLLSKPASPERNASNIADSLERNGASRMIVRDSEVVGNIDGAYEVETSLQAHRDPTHPRVEHSSWDEENVACAPERNQLPLGTDPDIKVEKTLKESPDKNREDSPIDAPSPTSSKSEDTNALSDGLPTSPLSACIPSSEGLRLRLDEPLVTVPEKLLNRVIDATPLTTMTKPQPPLLETTEEPAANFRPEPSNSSKALEVANPCKDFTPGILTKGKGVSSVVFKMGPLPMRTKKPALDLAIPEKDKSPEIKSPAFVAEEELEKSHNASMRMGEEKLDLKIVEEELAINAPADDMCEIKTPNALSEKSMEVSGANSTQVTSASFESEKPEPPQAEIILIGGTLNPKDSQEWLVSSCKSLYGKMPPVSTFLFYFFVAVYILITLLRSLATLVKKNKGPVQRMMTYFWSSPWALLFVLLTGSERLVLGVTVGVGLMLLEWGIITEGDQGVEELRYGGKLKSGEGGLESGV